jgi:hypothetical protein
MAATRTIEPAVRKIFRSRGRPGSVIVTAVAAVDAAFATGGGSVMAVIDAATTTATVPSGGAGVV